MSVVMEKKSKLKLFIDIFATFFKVGLFTFGGGFAMIPLIEKEMVGKKAWIKNEEIVDIFALAQSVPGAIAINSSTFIGYKLAGAAGALVATLGVVLPSFIIITLIAAFFSSFQDEPIVQSAFAGVRSAVVALVLMAAINIGKSSIKDKLTACILILAVLLTLFLDLHAIIIIIGGAAVGLVTFYVSPKRITRIFESEGIK